MESHEEVVVRESAMTKDGRKRFLLKIIGAVFVFSLLGGAAGATSSYFTLKGAAEDGTELAQQIKETCDLPKVTDPDLAQFCPKADQVVEAAPEQVLTTPTPGPPGEAGNDGADGQPGPAPTPGQVLIAVRRLCSTTSVCEGQDPTQAQVAVAVASYCGVDGRCRGVDGEDGTDAAPVTQEQLIQAVESYCAEGVCRGQDGQDGQDGTDGADSNVPGPQGPPGVSNVNDNCEAAPEGQKIVNVDATYDADNKTITISCSYGPDVAGTL